MAAASDDELLTPTSKVAWYIKSYTCDCGCYWDDEWDCLCNDRCPDCDAECEVADDSYIEKVKPIAWVAAQMGESLDTYIKERNAFEGRGK